MLRIESHYIISRELVIVRLLEKKISEEISWIGWWLNEVWSYELCLSILLCSDRKKFVLLNYFKRHFKKNYIYFK